MNMMRLLFKKLTLACLAMGSVSAVAQLPPVLSNKLAAAGLNESQVSVLIKPLAQGNYEVMHRTSEPRLPASTQKLVTTYVGLDTMGADYRWATQVYQQGVRVNNTLLGDLIIKGNGDPSFTYNDLRVLLQRIYASGIHHVQGDIIIDNHVFSNVSYDIAAFDGQPQKWYNAAPNALLINFGTVEIDVLADIRSSTALVQVLPTLADFEAPTTASAGAGGCGKKHMPWVTLTQTALTMGRVANNCGRFSHQVTFDDANKLAIKSIKGEWQKIQPDFQGDVRLITQQELKRVNLNYPILTQFSRPLSEQIYQINQDSNNVMTEQLALSIPLAKGEIVSDYPKAFFAIDQWWKANLTTLPPVITRASGLCRDCAITPESMASLLTHAYHSDKFNYYLESLPNVGMTGTMKSYALRNPNGPAIARSWVKTGTLDNVKAIAGYAKDLSDQWYVVIAIINAPMAGANTKSYIFLDGVLNTITSHRSLPLIQSEQVEQTQMGAQPNQGVPNMTPTSIQNNVLMGDE